MAYCAATSLALTKACSGKCKGGGGCTSVWVLAACDGMVALFSKQQTGGLLPLSEHAFPVSSFEGGLRDYLMLASEHAKFNQLVLVGSANDVAWMQASLPITVSKHVVAEIEYPLMADWFRQPLPLADLTHALERVFAA